MNRILRTLTSVAVILSGATIANALTINELQAGKLSEAGIDSSETTLTVKGSMNAADFFYILDNLNSLQTLDLSEVDIVAYNGDALPYTGLNNSPEATLPAYGLTGLQNLQQIVLPNSLKAIGTGALSGSGITTLTIPTGVTTIGDYAAMRCEALKSLVIPTSVTTIGERAFAYCPKLSEVNISATLSSIPNGLFEACGGLKSIDLSALAKCTEIGEWAFAECNGATTLVLPPAIEELAKGAIYGVSSVETLILPKNTNYIGDNAMSAMSTLAILNASDVEEVPQLGQDVWSNVTQSNVSLVVPDNQYNDYCDAEQWKEFNVIANKDWQSSTQNIISTIDNAGSLQVSFNGEEIMITAQTPLGTVSVFNAAGQRIATAETESNSLTFNTSSWSNGVYMIVCNAGVAKIII